MVDNDANLPYPLTQEAAAERQRIRAMLEKRKAKFRESRKQRMRHERRSRYIMLAFLITAGLIVGFILFMVGQSLTDTAQRLLESLGSGIVTTALSLAIFDLYTRLWNEGSEEADLEELFQALEDYMNGVSMSLIFGHQASGDSAGMMEVMFRLVEATAKKNGITINDLNLSDLESEFDKPEPTPKQMSNKLEIDDKSDHDTSQSVSDVDEDQSQMK